MGTEKLTHLEELCALLGEPRGPNGSVFADEMYRYWSFDWADIFYFRKGDLLDITPHDYHTHGSLYLGPDDIKLAKTILLLIRFGDTAKAKALLQWQ